MDALRQAKRVVKIVFGFTLLLFGALMLVLPGPGWVTIALGLAVLAAEFAWARRLLDRLKDTAGRLKNAAGDLASRRKSS